MTVLETNVVIRYLTQDDPEQARQAFGFLKEIESGRRSVLLPEGVLVEIVQVLSSRQLYNTPREEIRLRLSTILRLPAIKASAKRTSLRALDIYVDYPQLSFVDSLCAAYAEREGESVVVSFDRDFRRVPGITWEEP